MCGISGYIGNEQAAPILLNVLKKLEYRGYDSAGLAVLGSNGMKVQKSVGKLQNLVDLTNNGDSLTGTTGIGHTRWATHGKACVENAHPHVAGRFAIVHNGIIKNSDVLKQEYLSGVVFNSNTDTEVIVKLVELFTTMGETVVSSLRKIAGIAVGSWAVALIDSMKPDTVYVAKNKSPLVIGSLDECVMIASDIHALPENTRCIYEMGDMEFAEVGINNIKFFDIRGKTVNHSPKENFCTMSDNSDKGKYPHYMLKEIEQQPQCICRVISAYKSKNGFNIPDKVLNKIRSCEKMYLVACGSSYNASLIGKSYIEKMSHIPTEVCVASEFIYDMPLCADNSVYIFVSQSGETADCIAAMNMIRKKGHTCYSITNVQNSTLADMSDYNFHLFAGREVSVASTKCYTSQLAFFAIFANSLCNDTGIFGVLQNVSDIMESMFEEKEKYNLIASNLLNKSKSCFYIGRGIDYHTCIEASLKLKEVSYIHSEALPGGELKHGTIALIESSTPVIAINTQSDTKYGILANIEEVAARGANVVHITSFSASKSIGIYVSELKDELYMPFLSIIPAQYIAYYAAVNNGCDVDMPRNLAKSVTVE